MKSITEIPIGDTYTPIPLSDDEVKVALDAARGLFEIAQKFEQHGNYYEKDEYSNALRSAGVLIGNAIADYVCGGLSHYPLAVHETGKA